MPATASPNGGAVFYALHASGAGCPPSRRRASSGNVAGLRRLRQIATRGQQAGRLGHGKSLPGAPDRPFLVPGDGTGLHHQDIGSPVHRLRHGRMHADVRCPRPAAKARHRHQLRQPPTAHRREGCQRTSGHRDPGHDATDLRPGLQTGQQYVRDLFVGMLTAHRFHKMGRAQSLRMDPVQALPSCPGIKGRVPPLTQPQSMVEQSHAGPPQGCGPGAVKLAGIGHQAAGGRQDVADPRRQPAQGLQAVSLRRAQHHPGCPGCGKRCGGPNHFFTAPAPGPAHDAPALPESAEGTVHGAGDAVHTYGCPDLSPVACQQARHMAGRLSQQDRLRRARLPGQHGQDIVPCRQLALQRAAAYLFQQQDVLPASGKGVPLSPDARHDSTSREMV